MIRSPENTFLPKNLSFSATNVVFIVFTAIAIRSAHFFSDWLMFKIIERDWLMNLRGTSYRFDTTNENKRMKLNNDGKCLCLITQWRTVMPKFISFFFESKWTISFNFAEANFNQKNNCRLRLFFWRNNFFTCPAKRIHQFFSVKKNRKWRLFFGETRIRWLFCHSYSVGILYSAYLIIFYKSKINGEISVIE